MARANRQRPEKSARRVRCAENDVYGSHQERGPIALVTTLSPSTLLLSIPKLVVGSRYHALTSAMLQQVPCVGVGWSHKYSHLFEDFGASDMLLHAHSSREDIEVAIDRALVPDTRATLVERLREGARHYAKETDVMWNKVQQCLCLT